MQWVVLKFGGTSVATAERWQQIATRIKQLRGTYRVWVTASALSQVSNQLERAIRQAVEGQPIDALTWIDQAHAKLASDIGLSDEEYAPVSDLLTDLRRLLEGIRLTNEASPRLRARVMSFGELASTRLGVAALAHSGIEARWVDARDLLRSEGREEGEDRYLQAAMPTRIEPEVVDAAANGAGVVLTQGFIARTPDGATCLLGRGGSDTSAALFAALAQAHHLEIWTDVHGLFTTDPRKNPNARLIRHVDYREAQELAAMGAKVLHPRCLVPAAQASVPVTIHHTGDPDVQGTQITEHVDDEAAVSAVVQRRGVTLLTLSTLAMWGESGFLAKAFQPFAELGISIDLVATSQSAVSVTLDHIPGGLDGTAFRTLLERLGKLGHVAVIERCAVVSIVGRRIRTVLHELGPALQVFREHQVHLVSESSEDLNLSFVVDEEDGATLVKRLHDRLFAVQDAEGRLGPTWDTLQRGGAAVVARRTVWWQQRTSELASLVADGRSRYVYDLATVREHADALVESLTAVDRVYFAIKANPHPDILRTVAAAGLGLECVSLAEIRRVREVCGEAVPVLFTPNFCPVSEYAQAFDLGAEVTVDGPEVLLSNPDLFRGRDIAVRIDPGAGMGHHKKVVTAGAHAKFGHPAPDIDAMLAAVREIGARVVGLHAHVGSGIRDSGAWLSTGEVLASLVSRFEHLQWVDVGGGLGVVERAGQQPLDLAGLNRSLQALSTRLNGLKLRMEPGRYLVSEAGVLVLPVTQVRDKGAVRFVGVETGMNSLIRPALYGAWHTIHNISRLDDSAVRPVHVVGPICETGDVLGRDRLLPDATRPGDALLVENAGAYGRVMSSHYNLREPAVEVVLHD